MRVSNNLSFTAYQPDNTILTKGNFTRWMYRGQSPHWIAKFLNRIEAIIASTGIASNYLVTLEVTGRKFRRTLSLPVVITIVNEQRYLVSMLVGNVQWVQNVRAADQRAPILKAYRGRLAPAPIYPLIRKHH